MLHMPAASNLEGRILGGCRLLGRLSTSAMGDVYLAEQLSLGNRLVAVKVVPARAATDEETTVPATEARFMREAQVLAQFAQPNILTIHDSGVTDDLLYLVMQYVPDGSLSDVIRGKGHTHLSLPVSPERAAAMIGQIALALQYTHDRGMVHRDVKPSNVLVQVQPDGTWHLLLADFGIARNLESTAHLHHVMGTIAYMAPEQFTGTFSPASDQYSLGVLAYLLLAGRTPFQGTPIEVMAAQRSTAPPDIERFNPAVTPAISTVLMRALAKDPQARWPSVMAFSQALSLAAGSGAASAATREADALVPDVGVAPLVVTDPDAVAATATVPDAPAGARTMLEPQPPAPETAPTHLLPVYAATDTGGRHRRRPLLALLATLLFAALTLLALHALTMPSTTSPTIQRTSPTTTPAGNAGGSLVPRASPTRTSAAQPSTRPAAGGASPATPPPQLTRPAATPSPAPTRPATPAPSPTAQPTATPTSAPSPTTTATTTVTTTPADAANLSTQPSQVVVPSGKPVLLHATMTNMGTSTWSGTAGYAVACDTASHPTASGSGTQPVSLGNRAIAPGQSLSVAIKFTAPATPGTYQIWWNLTHNGAGFTTPDGFAQVTVTG